jgi:acetyltransferase-like isoleucine patch superfamily enzyme
MNHQKISSLHYQLKAFFQSDEKETSFMVDCELKDRIRFIYKVIFPKSRKYRFYFRFFLARIAFYMDHSSLKVFIYRLLGVKIGKGVFISPDVFIDVHFPKLIRIDDYAILGHGVSIFTHEFISRKYKLGRVHIGQGAVIGAFSVIGSGVNIDEQANITVRSTILKDVPAFHKSGTDNICVNE